MYSVCIFFFFFQAEDGIRDAQESRGLGDVYKRQVHAVLRQFGEAPMLTPKSKSVWPPGQPPS